jgi:aspartyl-tRNA(Asn)/glutamyl-tRNA(Gln) amidotransferase subunit C
MGKVKPKVILSLRSEGAIILIANQLLQFLTPFYEKGPPSIMKLSRAEVEHIAELAKLRLTEEEKIKFCEQLSAILEYAEMLQQLDTEAIPPTATVLPLQNVMRPDEVVPSFSQEDILANAPDAVEGCFRVRAILE